MTLARRMVIYLASLMVGLVLIGVVAVWGVLGMRSGLTSASDQYDQLRQLYTVALPLAGGRESLSANLSHVDRAIVQLQQAADRLAAPSQFNQSTVSLDTLIDSKIIRADLLAAIDQLKNQPDDTSVIKALGQINQALNQIASAGSVTRKRIDQINTDAATRQRHVLLIVAGLTAVIIVLSLLISVSQYRSVINPIKQLKKSATQLAQGQFDHQLSEQGPAELAELATEFNRMAKQLNTLYTELEHRVRITSNELAQSERLASVGFLAAGVAHEINNPLGIIATNAELTLDQLKRNRNENSVDQAADALTVICEEAFRCKSITEKLLSMSRIQTTEKSAVSLEAVAQDIASMVKSLADHRHKKLTLDFVDDQPCVVHAVEAEMKQVLLNLVINAMQAIDEQGQVIIRGRSIDDMIELQVEDDGAGMNEQALSQIFEPFYTKPHGQTERRGTGLGLSITHAIIRDHSGRINAYSDGVGKGCRFVIELPAMKNCVN